MFGRRKFGNRKVVRVNGPLAGYDIIAAGTQKELHLTLAQLLSSIVVGLGGGNILTQMAQKQAERVAKETLAASLQSLLNKGDDNGNVNN